MYEFRMYLFDNCIISKKLQDGTWLSGTQKTDANNTSEYNLKLFFHLIVFLSKYLQFHNNLWNCDTVYIDGYNFDLLDL